MPHVVLHMLHQSFVNLFWRPRRWLARADESVCIASHLSHFNPTVFCLKPVDNKERFYAEEAVRLMESWRNVGTSAARCGSPGPQTPVEWAVKAELLPSTSALRKSSTSLFFLSSVALNQGLFPPPPPLREREGEHR